MLVGSVVGEGVESTTKSSYPQLSSNWSGTNPSVFHHVVSRAWFLVRVSTHTLHYQRSRNPINKLSLAVLLSYYLLNFRLHCWSSCWFLVLNPLEFRVLLTFWSPSLQPAPRCSSWPPAVPLPPPSPQPPPDSTPSSPPPFHSSPSAANSSNELLILVAAQSLKEGLLRSPERTLSSSFYPFTPAKKSVCTICHSEIFVRCFQICSSCKKKKEKKISEKGANKEKGVEEELFSIAAPLVRLCCFSR